MDLKAVPLMLIVPVFLCLIAVNPPQHGYSTQTRSVAALEAPANLSHRLSGQGAPRDSYGRCLSDIASFERALKKAGITPVGKTECVADDSQEHYAPKFNGLAAQDFALGSITGSLFNSFSHCELQRLTLVQESTQKSLVVDSTCAKTANDMFTPVLLVRITRSLRAAAE